MEPIGCFACCWKLCSVEEAYILCILPCLLLCSVYLIPPLTVQSELSGYIVINSIPVFLVLTEIMHPGLCVHMCDYIQLCALCVCIHPCLGQKTSFLCICVVFYPRSPLQLKSANVQTLMCAFNPFYCSILPKKPHKPSAV